MSTTSKPAIPLSNISASSEQALSLEEKEILWAYERLKESEQLYQRHGLEFGKLCYAWRGRHRARGLRNDLQRDADNRGGFEAFLQRLSIPKSTAYDWIRLYEEEHSLRPVANDNAIETSPDATQLRAVPDEVSDDKATALVSIGETLPEETSEAEQTVDADDAVLRIDDGGPTAAGSYPVEVQIMLTPAEDAEFQAARRQLEEHFQECGDDLLSPTILQAVVGAANNLPARSIQ